MALLDELKALIEELREKERPPAIVLCESVWHDQPHSVISRCPACDGTQEGRQHILEVKIMATPFASKMGAGLVKATEAIEQAKVYIDGLRECVKENHQMDVDPENPGKYRCPFCFRTSPGGHDGE